MTPVLHSKPWITEEDIDAVRAVLAGGMIAQGEITARFEREVSNWVKANGGVAVGSGSSAIVLALMALDITSGDEIILPTYVCKSVAEAIRSVGAVRSFVTSVKK
jgi:dTDP-4-amino-4,6-dideoxygalactose transaminase